MKTHKVKSGDTLAALGQQYGVPWTEIAKLNGIPPPDYVLYVGGTLRIPGDDKPDTPKQTKTSRSKQTFAPDSPDRKTQKCDQQTFDPAIDQHLRVIDRETFDGKRVIRPYDPLKRSISIVQLEKQDFVEIDYDGPDVPPQVVVTSSVDPKYKQVIAGSGHWDVPVSFAHKDTPYKSSVLSAFTARHDPVEYYVNGLPSGLVTIKVYNPDQWLLEIDIPPFRSFGVGRTRDKVIGVSGTSAGAALHNDGDQGWHGRVNASTHVTSETVATEIKTRGGWSKKTSSEEISHHYGKTNSTIGYSAWAKTDHRGETSAGVFNFSKTLSRPQSGSAPVRSGKLETESGKKSPVSLKINGDEILIDVFQIIGAVFEIAKAIYSIKDAIKKLQGQIKVGWYFQLDFKLVEGKVFLGWGWRESEKDHSVFYHFAAGAELTLFEVKVEAGVGLELAGVGVMVGLEMTGAAELDIGPLELVGRGKISSFRLGRVEGKIGIKGKAVAKFGGTANVTAQISGGITIGCEFHYSDKGGSQFELNGMRDAVKAKITVQSTHSYLRFGPPSHERELITGGQLFSKVRFPGKDASRSAHTLNEREIGSRITTILDSGLWRIRFHEIFNTPGGPEEFDIETRIIAGQLARRIYGRRAKIDLTEQIVDGIAYAVREACERMGVRKWERDSVSGDKWYAYLASGEFLDLLKEAESPIKQAMKDISANAGASS